MIDDLIGYYSSELNYLRQMGAEFARGYPEVADRLRLEGDKCGDPHVERLLEGVALLAARVRRKIDDEFPEITDALLGLLYPHFQRPLPAMAIVQFMLKRGAGQEASGFSVERGLRLRSRPVDGLACRFLTTYPVKLWPIEVAAARLEASRVSVPGKPATAVALIQISLKTIGQLGFGQIPFSTTPTPDGSPPNDCVRFYLDGTGTVPYALYELILNHVIQIQIRNSGESKPGPVLELKPGAIEAVGFGPAEGMVDYSPRSFPGHRLLQEYFALPEKFLFFDLKGLEKLAGRQFGPMIDVNLFLNRTPPNTLHVMPENFRLGCTPIVNLFPMTAAPIALSHTRIEYPVIPSIERPEDTEVYAIDRVVGTGSFIQEDVEYRPFYSLRHSFGRQGRGGGPRREREAYWFASRRSGVRPRDSGTEVSLAFVDSWFDPHLPARTKVTVEATCTNRNLPSRLPLVGGYLDLELEAAAPVSMARCLRRPTASLSPPLGRGAQWRLISALALNHLSLAGDERGLEALRELLAIHDFAESPATGQLIEGVTRIFSTPDTARTGQRGGTTVCRGTRVTIDFDDDHFVGNSAFLMASVLERFLGQYASINSFSRLVARNREPERIIKQWPPRAGERILL